MYSHGWQASFLVQPNTLFGMTGKEGRATSDPEYNFERFEDFDHESRERKVDAGDEAVDGTLYQTDGTEIQLSSLWSEQPVVLEFGSITCPVFTGWIDRIDALAGRFQDEVDFYIVYSREEHPDETHPAHRTLDEKMHRVEDLKTQESPERTVLVDDIEGSVHLAYDGLPNSVYLIGTDGIIAYRADWIDLEILERKVEELLDSGGEGRAVEPESQVDNFVDPVPDIGSSQSADEDNYK